MAGYDIARPHPEWEKIQPELALINDLMGGTGAMRAAGVKWLPREQAESWEAWHNRLYRSVLFNGLSRCINAMCGHIISGDVGLNNADPIIAAAAKDIDQRGTSLTQFAMKLVYLLLRDGRAHIWVDAPKDGGMPYALLVEAGQMLGARRDQAGALAQVRIRMPIDVPDGSFGVKSAAQINYYHKDNPDDGNVAYECWQQHEASGAERELLSGGKWHEVQQGEMNIDRIPLVSAEVGMPQSGMVRPPLLDLAWLNLAHWQSASDQRHILHIARVPILFAKGIADGGAPLEIGPNRVIITDDPQADMKFIEHSGAAIAAGRQDLIDLEDKMMMMGLDMMTARQARPTATSQVIEQAHHQAIMGMVKNTAKDALTQMFNLMAAWQDIPATKAGTVVMPTPEKGMLRQQKDAEILLAARKAGDVNKDEFLAEIERRGVLSPRL